MHFFQSAVAGNDTQYIKGLQFKNPILRKKNENKAGKKCLEKISTQWDEMKGGRFLWWMKMGDEGWC